MRQPCVGRGLSIGCLGGIGFVHGAPAMVSPKQQYVNAIVCGVAPMGLVRAIHEVIMTRTTSEVYDWFLIAFHEGSFMPHPITHLNNIYKV